MGRVLGVGGLAVRRLAVLRGVLAVGGGCLLAVLRRLGGVLAVGGGCLLAVLRRLGGVLAVGGGCLLAVLRCLRGVLAVGGGCLLAVLRRLGGVLAVGGGCLLAVLRRLRCLRGVLAVACGAGVDSPPGSEPLGGGGWTGGLLMKRSFACRSNRPPGSEILPCPQHGLAQPYRGPAAVWIIPERYSQASFDGRRVAAGEPWRCHESAGALCGGRPRFGPGWRQTRPVHSAAT